MYYKNRYYHTELGRFASRDPTGFIDGSNLYRAYFIPDKLDPKGLEISVKDCIDTANEYLTKQSIGISKIKHKSYDGDGTLMVDYRHPDPLGGVKECSAIIKCPCCKPKLGKGYYTAVGDHISNIFICRTACTSKQEAWQTLAHMGSARQVSHICLKGALLLADAECAKTTQLNRRAAYVYDGIERIEVELERIFGAF